MKSLKPQDMKDYALTRKSADELKEEIQRLQSSIVALQGEIENIENELNVPTVGRGSPAFENVVANNIEVLDTVRTDTVIANTINSTNLNSNDVEFVNATVTNVLDAAHVNTPDLDAETASIDELQSENISVDVLAADEATITSLSSTTATIGTANIATANIGTYNVAKVDATEVETPLVKANEAVIDAAAIENAEVEEAVINSAEIEDLYNRNRYFQNDDNVMQLTGVEELHPGYIMIDTKGVQTAKIRATDDNGELFTVIYSNTRGTPLIQWSKRNDEAIQRLFYQYKTNKLYIETWESCQFQWQIDAFEDNPLNPQTYQDTFPESLLDCYRYNVTRKAGIVLMGDGEESTVLSVQGTIEGNFLVDSGEFTYVNFYSDSAYDLFKVAKAFFRTGSDEDGWRYEKAQVFGYLRHTDTVAPAYEPYTFTSSAAAYTGLNSMSGPKTSADRTFVDTDPLVNSVDCVYVTGGSTQLYTTVNGEYKKILKVCTTSDIEGGADYLWPIVWVEGDDVTSLASASIRLLEPRTVGDIPNLFEDISYYTATGSSHSPYRDEDNTEIEALEKVEYVDENTILLTIDNKYGQDEIEISGSEIQEDEKLPFVLGFTFRTPRVDKIFNEDSEPYPGAKSDNYYYGD